jgi:integrase
VPRARLWGFECCTSNIAERAQGQGCHDTRAIQQYLGHRSIASTVRYTALAPDRFKGFWKD